MSTIDDIRGLKVKNSGDMFRFEGTIVRPNMKTRYWYICWYCEFKWPRSLSRETASGFVVVVSDPAWDMEYFPLVSAVCCKADSSTWG